MPIKGRIRYLLSGLSKGTLIISKSWTISKVAQPLRENDGRVVLKAQIKECRSKLSALFPVLGSNNEHYLPTDDSDDTAILISLPPIVYSDSLLFPVKSIPAGLKVNRRTFDYRVPHLSLQTSVQSCKHALIIPIPSWPSSSCPECYISLHFSLRLYSMSYLHFRRLANLFPRVLRSFQ